jgi:hypothetical protein
VHGRIDRGARSHGSRVGGIAFAPMRRGRALRALPTTSVAAAGVLVAHWVAYVLAIPHARARDLVLAATGHGYWPGAVRLAIALAGCGLAALLLTHLDSTDEAPPRLTFSGLVLRLAHIQCGAFLAMETMERLAAHAPVTGVLSAHVIVLGVAIQVLTAGIGAFLLRMLDRAVAVVVASLRRPSPRQRTVVRSATRTAPFRRRLALAGASGLRGPPLR